MFAGMSPGFLISMRTRILSVAGSYFMTPTLPTGIPLKNTLERSLMPLTSSKAASKLMLSPRPPPTA
jgi:hypothetical protein